MRWAWGSERHLVHADGDYHGALHLWIYVESTGELLLWKWADCKDSWPGLWDIFQCWTYICWGHFPHNCQASSMQELQEEHGITLPSEAFELLFVYLQQ
ncbi:unnamed protein product [Sphagnum tenellum]